jgi:hypothetical protein
MKRPTPDIHSGLRRLFRSRDFVSRHPALKRDTKEARRFAEAGRPGGVEG